MCPKLARAARDGEAAARAEDGKCFLDSGPDLAPFAVEALGRPSEDAIALLRAFPPTSGLGSIGSAWQSFAALLQAQTAELLTAAESA